MTLKDLLIVGRQLEMSIFRAADIEQKQTDEEDVRTLRKTARTCKNKVAVSKLWWRIAARKWKLSARCKERRNCGKLNHFAKRCRSSNSVKPSSRRKNNRRDNNIRLIVGVQDDSRESS